MAIFFCWYIFSHTTFMSSLKLQTKEFLTISGRFRLLMKIPIGITYWLSKIIPLGIVFPIRKGYWYDFMLTCQPWWASITRLFIKNYTIKNTSTPSETWDLKKGSFFFQQLEFWKMEMNSVTSSKRIAKRYCLHAAYFRMHAWYIMCVQDSSFRYQ
jgi:hypothetical protein